LYGLHEKNYKNGVEQNGVKYMRELRDAVVSGEQEEAFRITETGLAEGVPVSALIEHGLYPAACEIARSYGNDEVCMAEILAKFELIQLLLNELIPKLRDELKGAVRGRLMIGSVQGNLIDFGKLILRILFIASGFEVIDLGTDVPPETFSQHVRLERPDILALAVYTRESLPLVVKTVDLLKQQGLRQDLKIMLGGWAVTPEFVVEAGADIFAVTAEGAVELCLAAVGA